MSAETAETQAREPSAAFVTLIAIAAGALVANLYYAQPLIAAIGAEIGIKPDVAGSIASVTQIGYGAGLFLLVSLADLVENKRLVLTLLAMTTIGLVGVATSATALPFFVASFLVGLCSAAAQVLVPFVARLVPEARRGRTVGNVMAGLLAGIMLARPAALFIAAQYGWRGVFWWSAGLMLLIGMALFRFMPKYQPPSGMHYFQILHSMIGLFRGMPVLRMRALYQALLFAAFNMFWTAAPIMLSDRFGLSQRGIALFALAGAGGALAAPIAGRLADLGFTRALTVGAILAAGATCYATDWAVDLKSVIALALLTIIFDAAIQTNQITSQRIILSAPQQARGRVNAIYMTINFIGGALGSVLGTMTYHWGGWQATAATGGLIGVLLLTFFCIAERKG